LSRHPRRVTFVNAEYSRCDFEEAPMRQAPHPDRRVEPTEHTREAARSLPAFADEPLVDYLLRALEDCRAAGWPLACRHGTAEFTITPNMQAADVVGAWHGAACVQRESV
jgi:hypothetical protein